MQALDKRQYPPCASPVLGTGNTAMKGAGNVNPCSPGADVSGEEGQTFNRRNWYNVYFARWRKDFGVK